MYGNDRSFTRSLKEEASELVGTVYGMFTHCRCIIQSIFSPENALALLGGGIFYSCHLESGTLRQVTHLPPELNRLLPRH